MAEEEKDKTKKTSDESGEKTPVKEILDEDENETIDQHEIDRVFRIHLGRIPTEEEVNRFEGIKEKEFKVLEDYVSSQEETIKNEEKVLGDSAKIKGDLANKEMKMKGQNNLEMMKAGMPPMPIPEGVGLPKAREVSDRSMLNGQAKIPQRRTIQDGNNFLVKFSK